jgi:hypothetical protein
MNSIETFNKKIMKKLLLLSILFLQISVVVAQNYYYIHPKTGIRERLIWIPTPLGTDARYITDNDSGEPKNLKIVGDPLKQKIVSVVLPTKETAILSNKGTDIQLKFASGKTRIYQNRNYWVDFSKRPVVDYIAVKYVWNKVNNQTDIRMFFRGLGSIEEVEFTILEKDEDKNKYIVTIPNKEGKYKIEEIEIEYERYWKLTSPDGKTQNFKGEF